MSDVHPATPMGSPPRQPGAAPAPTPGQAFYAAYAKDHPHGDDFGDWGDLVDYHQHAMEAGAQAAIDAGTGKLCAELARVRAELDDTSESWIMSADYGARLARERDEARELLNEILATYTGDPFKTDHHQVRISRATPQQLDGWRKRAGLEPS